MSFDPFFDEDDIPICPVCNSRINSGYVCKTCGYNLEQGTKTQDGSHLYELGKIMKQLDAQKKTKKRKKS